MTTIEPIDSSSSQPKQQQPAAFGMNREDGDLIDDWFDDPEGESFAGLCLRRVLSTLQLSTTPTPPHGKYVVGGEGSGGSQPSV